MVKDSTTTTIITRASAKDRASMGEINNSSHRPRRRSTTATTTKRTNLRDEEDTGENETTYPKNLNSF